MKFWTKLFIIIGLFIGGSAFAEQYSVLVLPASIFSVCQNYYCFEEPAEIISNDVINELNKSGKISAPTLYDIRKKINENPQLKTAVSTSTNKYSTSNYVDFSSLRKIANDYGVKSVLLISSKVQNRNLWEVLEISSVFEAASEYTLETNAVLLDNVNDVVMWSGKYKRSLGDNESRFWATNSAQANAQYEKIKFYSRDIVGKEISQNIMQRFFPKELKQVTPNVKPQTTDFRPNALENFKRTESEEYGEIESETIYAF